MLHDKRNMLSTCHPDLQTLVRKVAENYDILVIEGYRDPKRQLELFETGRSKVKFGKHNEKPSLAVDIAPMYGVADGPVDWRGERELKGVIKMSIQSPSHTALFEKDLNDCLESVKRWYFFMGNVVGVAEALNIKIRCGGDWNGNKKFNDQTFDDLVHFELKTGGVEING